MTPFTRILVPINFSPTSDAALGYAKMLAARFGASLRLLHVLEGPFAAASWAPEACLGDIRQIRATAFDDAELRLQARLSFEERRAFDVNSDVVTGTASRDIATYAAEHHIDLIVMGTHGRTGLAHALLGSVAERTLRAARCPVLTVRTPVSATTDAVTSEVSSMAPAFP